jgi:hypothetical protein
VTGPEHYQQAERLLAISAQTSQEDEDQPRLVWTANAHATLALAAATSLMCSDGLPVPDWDAWRKVASTKPDREVSK